jgi:transposase
MVVVGADVHKRTHTFVAVDAVGRQVGQRTVSATSEGHARALAWARSEFGLDLRWAIEDCRHLSARLERDLLSAGQQVVRVPPKMMAEQRRVARTRGKSDPIDALAVHQQSPHRQPWRDRRPRRPRLQGRRHRQRRRLRRARPRRPARQGRRRGLRPRRLDPRETYLVQDKLLVHRQASPAPTPCTPATASSPRTPPSPRPSSTPA